MLSAATRDRIAAEVAVVRERPVVPLAAAPAPPAVFQVGLRLASELRVRPPALHEEPPVGLVVAPDHHLHRRAASVGVVVHVEAGRVDEATSFIWQWAAFAARTAVATGTIAQAEADRWLAGLRDLNRRSELFGSVTYVGITARRP